MKNPNFKRHIKTEPDAGRANLSSCAFLLHRYPSRPRNVELDEGHVDLIIKWTVYITHNESFLSSELKGEKRISSGRFFLPPP